MTSTRALWLQSLAALEMLAVVILLAIRPSAGEQLQPIHAVGSTEGREWQAGALIAPRVAHPPAREVSQANLTIRYAGEKLDRLAYIGEWLICMMNSFDPTIWPQSEFTDSEMLTAGRYGWRYRTNLLSSDQELQLEYYGLEAFFSGFGISEDDDDWTMHAAHHTGLSDRDGEVIYPPTMGMYDIVINARQGTMIAKNSWSPEYMIAQNNLDIPPGKLVPLRRWSDIAYLAWATEPVPSRLRHVVQHHVVNYDSVDIIELITGTDEPEDVGKWPGEYYSITQKEGKALLAIPNGFGVCWLIGQHKRQLGTRIVKGVFVFDCAETDAVYYAVSRWCLDYEIVDGPLGPGEL